MISFSPSEFSFFLWAPPSLNSPFEHLRLSRSRSLETFWKSILPGNLPVLFELLSTYPKREGGREEGLKERRGQKESSTRFLRSWFDYLFDDQSVATENALFRREIFSFVLYLDIRVSQEFLSSKTWGRILPGFTRRFQWTQFYVLLLARRNDK